MKMDADEKELLDSLAVSPDGQWIAVQDPTAWGALVVYPAGTGSPRRLCDLCAPPLGTEPPAIYFGWAPNGEFAYWNFMGATYAIPLPGFCRLTGTISGTAASQGQFQGQIAILPVSVYGKY